MDVNSQVGKCPSRFFVEKKVEFDKIIGTWEGSMNSQLECRRYPIVDKLGITDPIKR